MHLDLIILHKLGRAALAEILFLGAGKRIPCTADDGKKFARPKIQEAVKFYVTSLQRISGQKLKDVLANAFIHLSTLTFELKASSLVHLDLIILHKLGRGAEMKTVAASQREEAESCWHVKVLLPLPRNTTRYTTRNTTRYTARNTTELLAGAAFWSFDAFKEWNENTSQFFCPEAAFR